MWNGLFHWYLPSTARLLIVQISFCFYFASFTRHNSLYFTSGRLAHQQNHRYRYIRDDACHHNMNNIPNDIYVRRKRKLIHPNERLYKHSALFDSHTSKQNSAEFTVPIIITIIIIKTTKKLLCMRKWICVLIQFAMNTEMYETVLATCCSRVITYASNDWIFSIRTIWCMYMHICSIYKYVEYIYGRVN